MATKSKKSKLYRLRYKGIAVFLFFTFAVSIFFCGIVGVNISRNWSWDVTMQIRSMIRRNSARPSAVRLTERCRRIFIIRMKTVFPRAQRLTAMTC